MRPEASHDPAVELMEDPSDVGSLVVMAPAAQDGIDLSDQLLGGDGRSPARQLANLVLEVPDRFLARVRVKRPRPCGAADLILRKL